MRHCCVKSRRQSSVGLVCFGHGPAIRLENSGPGSHRTAFLIDPDSVKPRGLDFESGQQWCVGCGLDDDGTQFDVGTNRAGEFPRAKLLRPLVGLAGRKPDGAGLGIVRPRF
jgi:hypothetical protein